MLVLTRRVGEELIIGDDVRVRILNINWTSGVPNVRVGIDAPDSTRVLRGELVQNVSAEIVIELEDGKAEFVDRPQQKKPTIRHHLRRRTKVENY